MNISLSFISGLLFGVGLMISGMTSPDEVIGFLDISAIPEGNWRWGLAGVMGGALLTHALLRAVILKQSAPLLGGQFPSFKQVIDARLMTGAALFGLGWGIGGFCPGPVLVTLTSMTQGSSSALIFVGAMVLGMLIVQLFEPKQA